MIDRNDSFRQSVSSKVGDVQSQVDKQMSAVKSSILSSLTGVKDKMKLGLGGVDKDVEKTQDHQESQQEEVRAALEKIVKDQVGLLLGQIQILNDNAAKQQEQSQ